MADRPAAFPRWATVVTVDPETGQDTVLEPAESKKDSGWSYKEKPPYEFFNWLASLTYEWLVYFDEEKEDVRLNNYDAAADPTVDDDETLGYAPGSVWFNTSSNEVFRLIDATDGAAVWVKTSLTLDELGSMASQDADNVNITGGSISGVSGILNDPGANGMVARTAADTTAARTIQGGDGVNVTNGDGVSGNPSVAVDSTVLRDDESQTLETGDGIIYLSPTGHRISTRATLEARSKTDDASDLELTHLESGNPKGWLFTARGSSDSNQLRIFSRDDSTFTEHLRVTTAGVLSALGGLIIGGGSTIIDAILSGSASVGSTSIPAHSITTVDVTVSGAEVDDVAIASPDTGTGTGIVITEVRVASSNTVRVAYLNHTTSSTNRNAHDLNVFVIKKG